MPLDGSLQPELVAGEAGLSYVHDTLDPGITRISDVPDFREGWKPAYHGVGLSQ